MKEQLHIDNPAWKLAGMEYSGGMYSPQEWQEKTGVDPGLFPHYFKTNRSNLCQVTNEFRRDYKIISDYKKGMVTMLTS